MEEKPAGYRHIPLQERIPLLLSHFFGGKAKGGRWETANWFLLLCNPTQVQILICFWMKNHSWPPHPEPWEITSNSCTNLSHLLQMSDGKAAVLWTLLLPASQGSLWVLPAVLQWPVLPPFPAASQRVSPQRTCYSPISILPSVMGLCWNH